MKRLLRGVLTAIACCAATGLTAQDPDAMLPHYVPHAVPSPAADAPYLLPDKSVYVLANDLVRVHTVSKEDNPLYWRLLHAFGGATGLPALYNTSFNLFGEPLVCTPRDAVRSFWSSGIDAMVVGNFLLQK